MSRIAITRVLLLARLLRRPRSLTELARELEASPRTVERDIHFLRSIGGSITWDLDGYRLESLPPLMRLEAP